MRSLWVLLTTMLLVIFLSQNAATASNFAQDTTKTPESSPTAERTFTPIPLALSPGTAYVHPSGLFSFQLPSDSWLDPAYPASLSTPVPDDTRIMTGQIAFMPCTTIQVIVERLHNPMITTVDDLSRTLDYQYFANSWAYYPDGWKEVRRRTDGQRLLVDFELYGGTCGQNIARQISRRYGDWLVTLRLIVDHTNPGLLDDLVKFIWPSIMTYDDALKTPLTWSASIDPIAGYILKYPPKSVVINNEPGDGTLVLTTIDSTSVLVRAKGEQSKAVYTEKQARGWVTARYPDASVITVIPETRANATGFSVVYTIPDYGGVEGSGLAVLLNGNNGTLYSTEYTATGLNFDLFKTDDPAKIQDLNNFRNALIIIPSTPVNRLGTLWLMPSSTPVVVSPTPTTPPISTIPPKLAGQPPAVQTQTARDLAEIHRVFDRLIPLWKGEVANDAALSVPGWSYGLKDMVKEAIYGKCRSTFYLFVVMLSQPDTGPADGEGYAYLENGASLAVCHPPTWTVYDSEPVGGNWYFVTLQSH